MNKYEITVLDWDEVEDVEYWVPGHGLDKAHKALAAGKKAVFLGACDCGCWTEEMSREATEMAATLGEDGPVYHNLHRFHKGYPVIILPKELRGRNGFLVAMSLPWKPDTAPEA